MDHDGPALGDGDRVPVSPHPREHVEVRVAVALALGVVPERDRHRRHRPGDDHLAGLAVGQPIALVVPDLEGDAERRPTDLPVVHGQVRGAGDEDADDVGAAAHRADLEIPTDMVSNPLVAAGRQHRAGDTDQLECRQIEVAAGLDAVAGAGLEIARTGAEHGDAQVLHHPPQQPGVRVRRAAVEENDGRTVQQPADLGVPHHPVGRGEPEEDVVLAEVHVEAGRDQLFEQRPSVAVDDSLGSPGRSRGEQHPQRMVERHVDRGVHRLAEAVELFPRDVARSGVVP
ncbi:hypothetical protein ACVW2K_001017 [Nocardioides sp. HB32]